jgi:site-specific recombinase XerD
MPPTRGGRRWSSWRTTARGTNVASRTSPTARFLTREELGRLLDEAPPKWRPLFDLLAATGLRISEAIALRWSGLRHDGPAPRLQVSRAIVSMRQSYASDSYKSLLAICRMAG